MRGLHSLMKAALESRACKRPDLSSQRERRTASIIATALAAAKIARNKRSPRANARPHPKTASAASATSSRKLGSVQGAFI
jgi:hypothetical protein